MIRATGRYPGTYNRRGRLRFARRITRTAARAVSGPRRFDALCQMIFDLGKVTGRIAETFLLTRSRRNLPA